MKIQPAIKVQLIKKENTDVGQIGKTGILHEVKNKPAAQVKKAVFRNPDNDKHFARFKMQDRFLQKLQLKIGTKSFVFGVEIQCIENADRFLKGIYDLHPEYKLVNTGSGSIELEEKNQVLLAEQKRLFEKLPVSIREFVNFKTDYRCEDRLTPFFDTENQLSLDFLNEYMNFGGFPKIITKKIRPGKNRIMNEISSVML